MVRKLGKLARLALTADEIERFGEQAERIFGYFRTLQKLNLTAVEPTSQVVDIECYRRPDQAGETLVCLEREFPYLRFSYFHVPRVIREEQ
jgi:aspartyl-tRNA(Asn)/glutamyl-tRNA(Gln) amidotransferase subunit C